jgi:integrase
MRGSLRQRGKSWECIVFVGRDVVTGRKRYTTRTVRGSRREAEHVLAEMVVDAERLGSTHTNATTGELLERWFEQATPDFSPSTVRETRGVLDRYLLPAFGDTPVRRLRASDIDRFYNALRTVGGHGRPLKPATVRRVHGILRRALAQGVKWGWLARNPAADATPPRVPKREIVPPEPLVLSRLFRLAEERDPTLAAYVVLAAASGARRSEISALRWSDLDLERGQLHVHRGLVRGPTGWVEKDTKTHASRRIALDERTVNVLRAHRAARAQMAAEAGTSLSEEGFVFAADLSGRQPVAPESITRAFTRLAARAGIEGVRLHDLRHYVATRLLASGVDVRTVAGRLGHRNPSTTLNVYSHFLPEADRRAAEVLAELLPQD